MGVDRHSRPVAHRGVPWFLVVALLALTGGSVLASARLRSPDLFGDPSGVVGPSDHVAWGASGSPLGAQTRIWLSGFFYGPGARRERVRVLDVALVPLAGMPVPRLVAWRVYALSGRCCAANASGLTPWPAPGQRDMGVFGRISRPRAWVTMSPITNTPRPHVGVDVVVSVAMPRHDRVLGAWGVVATYEESDGTVHTQTSNEGYVFCRARHPGGGVDWGACPNPIFLG